MLSREAILLAQDLKRERVHVPEWGGEVLVRTMTGAERDEFEAWLAANKERGYVGLRARIASLTVCDEDGKRLFTAADIPALEAKAAGALARIADTATRLSRLDREALEDAEKNSAGDLSDSSTSALPGTSA